MLPGRFMVFIGVHPVGPRALSARRPKDNSRPDFLAVFLGNPKTKSSSNRPFSDRQGSF
jgi:hypothetical protein